MPDPQVTDIRGDVETGNRYMLRKPAADGVVGNRKAIGFTPLPNPVPVGDTYTFYMRVNVEYFPNNHSFGLSNISAGAIPRSGYDSFEPMVRITDKLESDGYKNDGTLMVLVANKAYRRIIDPATGEFATQQRVFEGAEFRMQRTLPLLYFMAISNTGPHEAPYGNGGVRYDDIYMAPGRTLSSPAETF